MNSSLTSPRTSARGFTLAELMVATGLSAAVGLMVMSVLISTFKLSSQNAVTNISNYRARQTLDRLGELARYALDTPVQINADGSTATGTSSDGILVKNALGGPYVFKNSNGDANADIASGTKAFQVEYSTAAGAATPEVGDYFLLALSTQPELEVATVGMPSTSAGVSRVQVTTKQAITETAKPGSYTVTGSRYRKEAYIFAQSGTQWDLRHYPRVVAGMNYTTAASYILLGSGFQKLGVQPWFATVIDNGTQACWLRAVARSSNHAEYAESISGKSTLTTMPVQIKLWNYNAPPPPS